MSKFCVDAEYDAPVLRRRALPVFRDIAHILEDACNVFIVLKILSRARSSIKTLPG
jgi:hypothetical protein